MPQGEVAVVVDDTLVPADADGVVLHEKVPAAPRTATTVSAASSTKPIANGARVGSRVKFMVVPLWFLHL